MTVRQSYCEQYVFVMPKISSIHCRRQCRKKAIPVVNVEQPVDCEIDAERHGHLRRILGGYVFVNRSEDRDHIGNVNELVILCPEPVRIELFQRSRETQQIHWTNQTIYKF